ncbi:MAG: hypothetical protein ABR956_19205 [Terracidiphilus sp.]|jgi:hypothetical protein
MIDPPPIQTPLSITTGFEKPLPAALGPATDISWLPERIATRGAISQWLPMMIEASAPEMSTWWPINVSAPIDKFPDVAILTEEHTRAVG